MTENNEKFDVNRPEDLASVLKDRLNRASQRKMNECCMDKDPMAEHINMANLMIKVINVISMDPIIKKVMSMRIIGPLKTGKERSRFSIAIELGMAEKEVAEIEAAGLEILDGYLQRISCPDFIEKFNRDKAVQIEINKLKDG